MPRPKQNINEYFVGDVVLVSDKLFHDLHKSKIAVVVEKNDPTLYRVLLQVMDEPVWISYQMIKEVIYRQ